MNRPTVTLCMIVKDEEHIIQECLESMYPHIDRYDITDTGSTDRTKEIIKEFFDSKNIPGAIYDEPWEGFGKSRSRSMRNADKGGADYSWVIDADDRVMGNFQYPKEFGQHWAYTLKIHRGDYEWWRNQIFRNGVGWQYIGVIHEYADCPDIKEKGGTVARLHGDYMIDARTMGSRTKAFEAEEGASEEEGKETWRKKYIADAELLKACLTDPENINYEPDNQRYHFYIAQSYFDGGDWANAKEWYEKRAAMGGWEEEQWYSVLRVAMCMVNLNDNWQKTQDVFLQCYNLRPTRAEPLYHLSRIHRLNGNPRLGYLFSKIACGIPYPVNDVLFVSKDLYEWQVFDELASTAWYAQDMHAGLIASNKLIQENKYPADQKERVSNNWQQYAKWHQEFEKQKQLAIEAQKKQQEQIAQEALKEKGERLASLKTRNDKKKIDKRRKKNKSRKTRSN